MKNLIILKSLSVLFISILLLGCTHKTIVPNIILIMTDDQGYGDISAHGSPDVSTPNMDKLISQSVSFNNFHVSPTCAPTRSAILTGRQPFKNGITHTIFERERLALGITTLPQVLKRKNYISGIFGKWHLGDQPEYQPEKRGFDEVFIHGDGAIGPAYPGSCADVNGNSYFDPIIKHNGTFVKTKGFCTDVFFSEALSWIKQKSEEGEPFFAYIATNAPHAPFIAPDKYKEKFIKQNYPPNAQGFYGMIENIDDNLGLLMKKLYAWRLADNTILIFMSDNGKSLPGGKNNVHGKTYNAGMRGFKTSPYEGGTKAPFFIHWPGKFKAGREVDDPQNHYDILPTLADILDIDISDIPQLDGRSFYPYLLDDSYEGNERYRFVHVGRWPLNPKNINGQKVNKKWLGTEKTSNPDYYKYTNCAVRGIRYKLVNNSELYDLYNDPAESHDIAAEHPEIVEQMKRAYDKWWREVRPFMVNENVPLAQEKPFWMEYKKQKESGGIKDWIIPNLD
ncbi:arylsulfatase [bacterium]|nr:arylsulfatase [bacterium]